MKKINMDKVLLYLSSATKRAIILHLYTCQCLHCYVGKICSLLNQKQANISKHLIDLKEAHIVSFCKQKQHINYYLTKEFKNEYIDLLYFLKTKEEQVCYCQKGEENEC